MKPSPVMSRSALRALRPALLALAVNAACTEVLAQDENNSLATVQVTATRADQAVEDVAATVTVIETEDIQRSMATDIRDLFRHEPGVSVRSQPYRPGAALGATGRGGNEGINIRGMEGNRVLLQTDGVRLPATFSFGPQTAGRGDYLEIEGYKRVEILRGPASTLYGSDGLGGAVSFQTKDVDDLLDAGRSSQVGLRTAYTSVDDGWLLSPAYAARGEHFEGMILGAFRWQNETETGGSNNAPNSTRTEANPQDIESTYVLAKLGYRPNGVHAFKLTLEHLDRDLDANVLSGVAPVATTPTSVTALTTDDEVTRKRAKLDYRYADSDNTLFQLAQLGVYVQDSTNRQFADERRNGAANRTRDNHYDEKIYGVSAQFESNFGQDTAHRLVYGIDYDNTEVHGLRDGTVPPANESFPTKPFPDTDYRLLGMFAQDEIAIDQVVIIPGIRYDHFELDPRTGDPQYVGLEPTRLSDGQLSPKLGAIWRLHPLATPFVQYAFGFRAPTPNDVNNGFTNLTSSTSAYQTISNPDLKPETSQSFEIGLRGADGPLRYSMSVFNNRYEDFIESTRVGGTGTPSDPLTFQSVNLDSARIRGFELNGEWTFMPTWSVVGSLSKTRGHSNTPEGEVPLETIDPGKVVVGLRHEVEARYGLEATLSAVERKKRPHDETVYAPSGFAIVDLTGHYQIAPNAHINAGLFNLFDRKYFLWADTRSISSSSTTLDAFSQAGRNFAVSLNYKF